MNLISPVSFELEFRFVSTFLKMLFLWAMPGSYSFVPFFLFVADLVIGGHRHPPQKEEKEEEEDEEKEEEEEEKDEEKEKRDKRSSWWVSLF